MKKFTIGAIVGATSLAVAFPLLAQFAGAAESTTQTTPPERPVQTQACVQALASRDDATLSGIDALIAAQKSATLAHRDALTAAAALTDDTARQEAVQKADEAFRTAMDTARKANTAEQTAMEAVKTACGDAGFGGRGMMGFGQMEGRGGQHGQRDMSGIAEKLGMTSDELKTALDSGKTIQDLATEKGVTLPTPPARGDRPMGGCADDQDSSAK
ncbi:MAG: hypothetical protein WCS85_02270 [Candidatus Peribacteraceae bacterium]